jgi:periplasmic divalent cation tolerance protein
MALLRGAVQVKLAAGGQIAGPVRTAFWHLGELGEGEEWRVTLTTTASKYPELEAHLIEQHPWDNPEVTYVPIEGGSAAYLSWVERTTE